jgi:hypothetical protein
MTQPTEAVSGPEPTLEDRLSAALNADDAPEAEATAEAPENDVEPEIEPEEATEGDEPEEAQAEDETEIEADDLPPIEAPVSWTAEEKATFAQLPRDVQETLSRREGEREKFVQTKAQEARHKEQAAMKQAAEYIQQIEAEAAMQLETLATQFAVPEPDMALMASDHPGDRALFAQQARAFNQWKAQLGHAQQTIQEARERQSHYQALVQQHEQEQFRQLLTTELPEFFDDAKGPQIREALTATGKALGFTDEALFNADAHQILALHKVADLKAKADKYDKLMAKQMERVRSGKGKLPPVSKPGAAKGPEARQQTQYQADREALRRGDKDATTRILSAIINNP